MLVIGLALGVEGAVASRASLAPADDFIRANAGEVVHGDLLANDAGLGPDASIIRLSMGAVGADIPLPAGGVARIDAGGAVMFDLRGAHDTLPLGAEVSHAVGYTVRSAGLAAEATVTLTAVGSNRPPQAIGLQAPLTFDVGETRSIDVSGAFSDPGDTLMFQADDLPDGFSLSPDGILHGAPVERLESTVTLIAVDRAGQRAETSVTIVARLEAPIAISPSASRKVNVGEMVFIDLKAAFSGRGLRFSLAASSDPTPQGMTFADGVFYGQPIEPDSARLVVVAQNDAGTAETTLTLSVEALPAVEGPWTPAQLPQMRRWDARLESGGVVLANGVVQEIADLSGAGDRLLNTAAGGQPTYSTAEAGGTILFNSATTPLTAQLSTPVGGNKSMTFVYVGYGGSGSHDSFFQAFTPNVSGSRHVWANGQFSGHFYNDSTVVSSLRWQGPRVLVLTVDGSAGATGARPYRIRRNGSHMFSGNVTSAAHVAATANRIILGDGSETNATRSSGRFQWVGVMPGVLSDADIARIEGWAAWSLPLLGANGSVLPADHPYKAAAPSLATIGLTEEGRSLTAYTGVQVDFPPLNTFFMGATSYSVASDSEPLPDGLSIEGARIVGAPADAGGSVITIRASNSGGDTRDAAFAITASPPPAVATDFSGLFAAAAIAGLDAQIAISEGLKSSQADLYELAALPGDVTAKVVGVTDFRGLANMPADLDYGMDRPIRHRNAAGREIIGAKQANHPVHGSQGRLFFGPETTFTDYAPPFDHDVAGVPLGLKVYHDDTQDVANNGLRHTGTPADGHIVFAAEYRMADGSRRVFWQEIAGTRAKNPMYMPRAETVNGTVKATHLLRLVTLQVAPFAEVPALSSDDARAWALEPKRVRSDYAPHFQASNWSQVEARIAALTDATLEDGTFAALAPGEPYVIELAPGIHTSPNGTDIGVGLGASASALSALTRHRVFITGTPGKTIIPQLNLGAGVVNVDFGWLTIRATYADRLNGAPLSVTAFLSLVFANPGSEARFFGVIVDGVDGAWTNAFYFDRRRADDPPGARIQFYDGYIGGTSLATTSFGDIGGPDGHARVIFARSLIDVAGDLCQMNGPIRIRWDSNYIYGSGNWVLINSDQTYTHRDYMGQYQPRGSAGAWEHISLAYYDNVVHTGPNTHDDAVNRGEPQLMITDNARFDHFEVTGNVMVQDPLGGRGIGVVSHPRKIEGSGQSTWLYGGVIAYNVMLVLPDTQSNGFAPPQASWPIWLAGGLEYRDGISIFGNVTQEMPRALATLDRTVELLPDGIGGQRATFPTAAQAFESFPTVTGTWTAGYTLDWSGTAYGGTSREGYISARDVAAKTILRRFSANGQSGGPGLPSLAEMAGRYTELPEDMNAHIGWDIAGSGVPTDWFEDWAPTPFALSGGAPAWPAGANDREIIVNTRIATMGAGKLVEEVAPSGALWRLEIESDGKPAFTIVDADGIVTHRVRSRFPVAAGEHLLFQANMDWVAVSMDPNNRKWHARQIAREHDDGGGTDLRRVRFIAQPEPPAQPNDSGGLTTVWCDTGGRSEIYEWRQGGWRLLGGHLSEVLAAMMTWWATANSSAAWTYKVFDNLTMPTGQRTIWFVDSLAKLSGVGVEGDFARVNGEPYVRGAAGWTTRDETGWIARPRGELRGMFRIGGERFLPEIDWLWSQTVRMVDGTENGQAKRIPDRIGSGAPLPRGTVTLGGFSGTVNYFEMRRGSSRTADYALSQPQHRQITATSMLTTFRRRPIDAATGGRGGLYGPAHVWRVAP
jgi:hypothetical protein